MKKEWIDQIKAVLKESQLKVEEPMSRHTTFRIGGPAELYVEPTQEEMIAVISLCTQEKIPYTIIGNGSNLLVGDKGIEGLVLSFGKPASLITVEDNVIEAQGGAMLSAVSAKAADSGLEGMEFAAGIPGTVGGAVVMNAGAYGGEMKDVLKDVTLLTREGEVVTLPAEELELSYRHSNIPMRGSIVLSVRMELSKYNREEIFARMRILNEQRVAKQPLNVPSAGSTFKRPKNHFTGKLISDAGLRGYQVGGAQVSEKHCGFVVNTGNATASDVRQLIDDVSRIIEEKYHVQLEPEVKMIGKF